MRKQDNPRGNQRRADRPDQVAFRGRERGGGGSKGPHMHGMAGRKGIEALSGERRAVKVSTDGINADGKPFHTEWTGKFDGKDYPDRKSVV